MSLSLVSFFLAFCFSLNRKRVFRISGPASLILLLIQEDGTGKSVCLCTAGIWLSDLLERGIRNPTFIACFTTRAAPLALMMLSCMSGHFSWGGSFQTTGVVVALLIAADSFIRMKRLGASSLLREYGYGSLSLLTLSITGAFAEEVLFRGVLLSAFTQTLPLPFAVTGSAALFGLLHLSKGSPSGWPGVVETFLLGVLLGSLVVLTEGIAASIVVHGIGIPYLLRMVTSIRMEEAA